MTNTAEALDQIKAFVRGHKYYPLSDYTVVTLHDGVEFQLRRVPSDDVFPYSLHNDTRAMVFETVEELRGWLRCYRSMLR